ncbi:MAG: hypothetical protein KKB20_04960 [Proteobacteria bacterium]|nr:hypothetical protein [Pseudomonadota bacterium]
MPPNRKYHGFIGLAVLIVSEVLMLADVWPFPLFFYKLAWWSYILVVDHAVYHLTGDSLWTRRRREFLILIPMSVAFWMIFDGFNVYLDNWRYVGITRSVWLRWVSYFIAYGTVLPGIFETFELLEALGLYRGRRVRPISHTRAWYRPFVLIGVFFLFAPIFWPRYFFPLVWGGFIFLLEPAVHARGGRSLMGDWERGDPRRFYLLLTAGLICGGLWEFWNFWAVSKWVYNIPFVHYLQVFEMPLLGFGGFPPFAVELYVMTNFVSLFRQGRGWSREDAGRPGRTRPAVVALGLILFIAIYLMVGRSIEYYIIRSYV